MPQYTYIEKQEELDRAIDYLSSVKRVGLDTESSGYYTYEPEICLIQATANERHFIIDPLAGLDLQGLGPIFGSPDIQKIFHSAFSDVQELRRLVDWEFKSVYDTFIASRMLGLGSCSLASLVETYCGVVLQKGEQKSNWKRRPLSRSQLDYANLDTVYLERITDALTSSLAGAGLLEEFFDEVEWSLQGPPPEGKSFDPEAWMGLPGAQDLSPLNRGYLKGLFALRDRRSRELNLTPFRFIGNRELVELAKRMPETKQELERSGLVHQKLLKEEGAGILGVRDGAERVPDSAFPVYERPDPVIENRFRQLKKWRAYVSEERNMDPSVIVNNKVLYKLANVVPSTEKELASLHVMSDLKLQRYGKELIQVLLNGFVSN